MKFKNIKKYFVIVMAVAMVASFAVIPTNAECADFEGGHGDDYAYCGGTDYLYWAWGCAYCPHSPYWCYINTTCGYSSDSGDPGGWDNDSAQASVSLGCDTEYDAKQQYIIDADEDCRC